METIFVACAGSLIAAVVSLITLFTNRKWAKDDKADEVIARLDTIEDRLDKHIKAEEVSQVKQARTRILRFADECRRGEQHSEEFFDNMMEEDIPLYEHYCENHKDFKNNKAELSIEIIEDAYKKCLLENKFI